MEFSADLKNTVVNNPHLKEVHFAENGDHYFGVHSHEGDKYGRLTIEKTMKGSALHEVKVPVLLSKIAITVIRAEILGEPVKKSK
jgi:hypothetical protein